MEKSFLALKNRKARDAYVKAELVNGLAHQIRIIRQQRGWSQSELAKLVGTTQTTISRLEDPSYGKYSIRTLLALGKVFDVALFVRYMQFSKFMPTTWNTRPEHFQAEAYENEFSTIGFYTETKSSIYAKEINPSSYNTNYTTLKISNISGISSLPSVRITQPTSSDLFVYAVSSLASINPTQDQKLTLGDNNESK